MKVLEALGVRLEQSGERIVAIVTEEAEATECQYTLPYPSVGATENGILAAVLRRARTVYRNVAKEPEITALCEFLNNAGAKILGAGTDTLIIEPCGKLRETVYTIPGDRIAALTYLAAGAITNGDLTVTDVPVEQIRHVGQMFAAMGCRVTEYDSAVRLAAPAGGILRAFPLIKTLPYPGFPTDMQSQMMSLCCIADGISTIYETVFENRFQTAEELKKMGAEIGTTPNCAVIYGRSCLKAADVEAKDLRGGAALVLAALAAEGTSRIKEMCHVERGYENIAETLCQVGAHVTMVKTGDAESFKDCPG
jgi:UDP-N-acetylglucosamine 1-carboxyvinyltransferase